MSDFDENDLFHAPSLDTGPNKVSFRPGQLPLAHKYGIVPSAVLRPVERFMKNATYLYFCKLAGPLALIFFEGKEDVCSSILFPCKQGTETDEDRLERHRFLKENSILKLVYRRKSKVINEPEVTPTGEKKYYLICALGANRCDMAKVYGCLKNIAKVSFNRSLNFIVNFL